MQADRNRLCLSDCLCYPIASGLSANRKLTHHPKMELELCCVNRGEVVTVGFGVVAANFDYFGDESLPWPAL